MIICNFFDATCVHSVEDNTTIRISDPFCFHCFSRGRQNPALIATVKTSAGSISFNSWLRCYCIVLSRNGGLSWQWPCNMWSRRSRSNVKCRDLCHIELHVWDTSGNSGGVQIRKLPPIGTRWAGVNSVHYKLDGKYSERVQIPAKAFLSPTLGNTCHTYYFAARQLRISRRNYFVNNRRFT